MKRPKLLALARETAEKIGVESVIVKNNGNGYDMLIFKGKYLKPAISGFSRRSDVGLYASSKATREGIMKLKFMVDRD